jgi:hypothetical protein
VRFSTHSMQLVGVPAVEDAREAAPEQAVAKVPAVSRAGFVSYLCALSYVGRARAGGRGRGGRGGAASAGTGAASGGLRRLELMNLHVALADAGEESQAVASQAPTASQAPVMATPASQATQPVPPLLATALSATIVMQPALLERLRTAATDDELRHLSASGVRNLTAALLLTEAAFQQLFPGAPHLGSSLYRALHDADLPPPPPAPLAAAPAESNPIPAATPRLDSPPRPPKSSREHPPTSPESAAQQPARSRRRSAATSRAQSVQSVLSQAVPSQLPESEPEFREYPCCFPECDRVWAEGGSSCPDDGDEWQECQECVVFCLCPDHGTDGSSWLRNHEANCDG